MFQLFPALLFFLLAVTLDSLTAGLTYGTRKVRIQPLDFLPSFVSVRHQQDYRKSDPPSGSKTPQSHKKLGL